MNESQPVPEADIEVPKPQLQIDSRSQLLRLARRVFGPLVQLDFAEVDTLAVVESVKSGRVLHTLYNGVCDSYAEVLLKSYEGVREYVKATGALPPGVYGPGFMLPQAPKRPHKVGARRGEVRRRMATRKVSENS